MKPSWLSTRVACGCAAHSSSPRVDWHALARENCVLLSMTPADLFHRMCCGPVVTTCSVSIRCPGAAAQCLCVDPIGLQGRNFFWIHTLFPPSAQARTAGGDGRRLARFPRRGCRLLRSRFSDAAILASRAAAPRGVRGPRPPAPGAAAAPPPFARAGERASTWALIAARIAGSN